MRKEVQDSQRGSQSIIGYGIEKFFGQPEHAYVVDSNIPIIDSDAIDNLEDGGTNAVIMPWMSLSEIDALKNDPDLRRQISKVSRIINRKLREKDPNFYIAQGDIRDYPDLDAGNPDHHIIATCLRILSDFPGIKLSLISNDTGIHTIALRLGIKVEEYKADQVNRVDFEQKLPRILVDNLKELPDGTFQIINNSADEVLPNTGAIIHSRDEGTVFSALRKGDIFLPISHDISAMGISPISIDEEPNWAQQVALAQLLDPTISLVTLHGEAGTGKTLLSIAAAVNQLKLEEDRDTVEGNRKDGHAGKRVVHTAGNNNLHEGLEKAGFFGTSRKRYRKIYIARPFIHLGGTDRMGFLPGDIEAKSIPWLAPIYDNFDFIASRSDSNKLLIEKINKNKASGVEILPLSLIRGRTLAGAFVIIDEAQNLTRAEMKTIVTRAGEDTKLVLVGDINQIDIRWIDKLSSGLTHVTVKMKHLPYFGNTFLNKSVRSQMASDAAELL